MNPNIEQIKTGVQWFIGVLTPLLVSYGLPSDKIGMWTNLLGQILPPVAMFVWAMWDRTHKNTLAQAGAILKAPGLDGKPSGTIVVSDQAKDGAAAAADDPNVKNVNYGPVKP